MFLVQRLGAVLQARSANGKAGGTAAQERLTERSEGTMSIKFKQIAVASDSSEGEILYALSEDGRLYEKAWKQIRSGQGCRSVTWWREVILPTVEPKDGRDE